MFVLVKGWKLESGDAFFQRRQERADTADKKQRRIFYHMMRNIGFEMNSLTGAISPACNKSSSMQVLDLCMAPGGFTAGTLALKPTARIDAICLNPEDGGHQVLVPFGAEDSRVQVLFMDITMLVVEYGVSMDSIPTDHPDAAKFKSLRPCEGKQYDLVLCDGQVLRTQKRETYREQCEPTRLTTAQLILALQRIKPGGTLIILLHKLEKWHSMMLVRSFSKFATIELFKPSKTHIIRSSFYMIAKNVQPQCTEARTALEQYRTQWRRATFGHDVGATDEKGTEDVAAIVAEFGPRLAELGRKIWAMQADALEKAPFMQNTSKQRE